MLELLISTRLQILLKLKERPYTISELSKILGFSKTTASYHLERLQAGGLVERVERGKWVYYRITERGLKSLQIRVLASLIFLSCALISAIVAIVQGLHRIKEAGMAEITKKVTPTATEVTPDYFLLQLVAITTIALISFILFLYFRR
ncbi:MAG: winged helix-turn-helix domain-containing protein [Archaeoglobi archaeon]|nr:winged helix-turn-helix domain-containing protein [Archaeoglobi archaeon]